MLIAGCGQKDPVGTNGNKTGSVFVTTNIPGAAIRLDDQLRSEVTPDTLTGIAVGSHAVAVEKEGYSADPVSQDIVVEADETATAAFTLTETGPGAQRIVLLEDFSNTGCIPCVVSDSIVTEILDAYGAGQLIAIQYHVYWPYPGDPFYLAARDDNNARTSYYSVESAGVPYIVVNGTDTPSPTDAGQIETDVESGLQERSSLELRVQNSVNGTSGTAEAVVIAHTEPPSGNLSLHFALLEGNIDYQAQNGLTHFDNILRAFLPDASGETIHPSAGDTLTFTRQYTVDSGWTAGNLSVVVFVQHEGTREILQAVSSLTP